MRDWLLPFLFGTSTGVLSAWGVGGGTLLLLCMTLILGVEQGEAQGINLLYFLPTAAVSLYHHRKNGYLEPAALRYAVPLGSLSALGGALLATEIDLRLFRKPFGLFLLLAAGVLLFGPRKTQEKN